MGSCCNGLFLNMVVCSVLFFCCWGKPELHCNTTWVGGFFLKQISELYIKDLAHVGGFLQPKETVLFIKS